jgi:hypothetical protein
MAEAVGVMVSHDYLKLQNDLLALKKAIARKLFLKPLQTMLEYVNAEVIKCSCRRCMDMQGGNYPKDEEYKVYVEGESQDDMCERYWGPVDFDKSQPRDDYRQCRLYAWFKSKCREFNVLEPNDAIESPGCGARSQRMTVTFGMESADSFNGDTSWNYRIKNMPYEHQVRTLYAMLHSIHNIAYQEDDSFEQWFHLNDISLST